jgi:hypothetical protein
MESARVSDINRSNSAAKHNCTGATSLVAQIKSSHPVKMDADLMIESTLFFAAYVYNLSIVMVRPILWYGGFCRCADDRERSLRKLASGGAMALLRLQK